MTADLLVASNRGPVSYRHADDASLVAQRGAGGLVSGLAAAKSGGAAVWVCAALSDADREATRRHHGTITDAFDGTVRMLEVPSVTFERAYNGIANSVLWFISHMLYGTATTPVFDVTFRHDWQGYCDYNAAFTEALAAEAAPNARVLVQDYHLFLVPGMLRALRPDLRIGHFTHTPWAPPDYFALLPSDVAHEVLAGMLGADRVGFLTSRWARAFVDCAVAAGAERIPGGVRYDGRETAIDVHALGVDAEGLQERAHEADVALRMVGLRELADGRQLVVRVDRTELSKNIVRGLLAYRELLRSHPEWIEQVVHVAFAYPSRHDLPEYREYTAAVQRTVREINDEFASHGWQPVRLEVSDDYPRSLAAMRLADVLVVNPIRDGMNLVAKEGPVLSDVGVALVLSREAGAAEELSSDALMINPYDIVETAEALHEALAMSRGERHRRSMQLSKAATALPPARWFSDQVAALGD